MSVPVSLQWGSSEVDWCEANYSVTHMVAEFYNTVSNVLFFVFPPLLIYLFRQYARQVTWGVNIVWILLVVVGLGSVYFHTTLSLVGQLIDEIAIIWVVMVATALWFPRRYMPVIFKQDRRWFQVGLLFFCVLSTGLACVHPAVNALVLCCVGLPAVFMMIAEIRSTDYERARKLGIRCCLMWCVAIASWLSDRFLCHMWQSIGFPYLHCLWHIAIFISSYTACVLFAFFSAQTDVPEQKPVLRYWPLDTWDVFGIPYVTLTGHTNEKPMYKDL